MDTTTQLDSHEWGRLALTPLPFASECMRIADMIQRGDLFAAHERLESMPDRHGYSLQFAYDMVGLILRGRGWSQ